MLLYRMARLKPYRTGVSFLYRTVSLFLYRTVLLYFYVLFRARRHTGDVELVGVKHGKHGAVCHYRTVLLLFLPHRSVLPCFKAYFT